MAQQHSIVFYEWIQSDGNANILTDYIPNSSTTVEFKCMKMGTQVWFFGSRVSNGNQMFCIQDDDGRGNISFRYAKYTYQYKLTFDNTKPHIISMSSSGGYYDGKRVISFNNYLGSFTYPISFFAMNNSGTTNDFNCYNGKIYYWKVTEGSNTIMHLKPCTFDGVAGMYDTINERFYDTGQGNFTVGGEIMALKNFKFNNIYVNNVTFNGIEINRLQYNGVTVWEK